MLTVLIALSLVRVSQPEGTDRRAEDLCNLVRGLQRDLVNIECEYEGGSVLTKEALKTSEDGPIDSFTGLFLRRQDGAWLYDYYSQDLRKPSAALYRETIQIKDGRRTVLARSVESPKTGSVVVGDSRYPALFTLQSPFRVLCIDHLISAIDYADKRLKIQPAEIIDGHRCEVLDVILSADPAKDTEFTTTERFWIDLERGGHPIRVEETYPDHKMISRLVVEAVEQFDAGGRKIWIPTRSTDEGFAWAGPKRTPGFLPFPTSRQRIFLIRDSLRFPKEIPDSRLNLNYRPGTIISDNLKKKQVEFSRQKVEVSHDRGPTRDETEQQLQEQLRLAEEQKKELQASSWEREGDFPLGVVALVVGSVVVLAVGGFLLLRQRMS